MAVGQIVTKYCLNAAGIQIQAFIKRAHVPSVFLA